MSEPIEDNAENAPAPAGESDVTTPNDLDVNAVAAAEADALAADFALDGDSPAQGGLPGNARRLLKLPVTVVVYLAEKKIEMEQLLTICPGSLITFNKPCEDLLDLYVNNHRYCRGEAVKIGEKFGLKINEVGVVDVRESPILV